MRYASIDLETTGLNPKVHNIVEFGAVLDDTMHPEVDVSLLPRFHAYVLPPYDQEEYTGHPFALAMHPAIFKCIANRTPPFRYLRAEDLGLEFSAFLFQNGIDLSKPEDPRVRRPALTAGGKNFGTFDLRFLRECPGFLDAVPFRHRVIDPCLAAFIPSDEVLPETKLCAARLGVVTGADAHTAIEDAMLVTRMIRAAIQRLTPMAAISHAA